MCNHWRFVQNTISLNNSLLFRQIRRFSISASRIRHTFFLPSEFGFETMSRFLYPAPFPRVKVSAPSHKCLVRLESSSMYLGASYKKLAAPLQVVPKRCHTIPGILYIIDVKLFPRKRLHIGLTTVVELVTREYIQCYMLHWPADLSGKILQRRQNFRFVIGGVLSMECHSFIPHIVEKMTNLVLHQFSNTVYAKLRSIFSQIPLKHVAMSLVEHSVYESRSCKSHIANIVKFAFELPFHVYCNEQKQIKKLKFGVNIIHAPSSELAFSVRRFYLYPFVSSCYLCLKRVFDIVYVCQVHRYPQHFAG